MTSRRFPGVELEEWRSRLLDAHPRLFPDARPVRVDGAWMLADAGRPDVPDGWRRVLEQACARLEAAVRDEGGAIAILDVKEKYGTLRLTVSALGLSNEAQVAVDMAVDLAEFRSAHVCSACGEAGRTWIDRGWLTVSCDRHGRGKPLPRPRGGYVQVTTRWAAGKSSRTARRYLPESDEFVPVPVPEPTADEDRRGDAT